MNNEEYNFKTLLKKYYDEHINKYENEIYKAITFALYNAITYSELFEKHFVFKNKKTQTQEQKLKELIEFINEDEELLNKFEAIKLSSTYGNNLILLIQTYYFLIKNLAFQAENNNLKLEFNNIDIYKIEKIAQDFFDKLMKDLDEEEFVIAFEVEKENENNIATYVTNMTLIKIKAIYKEFNDTNKFEVLKMKADNDENDVINLHINSTSYNKIKAYKQELNKKAKEAREKKVEINLENDDLKTLNS